MTVTSKKKVCYCCVFQKVYAERQSSKISALLRARQKSEWNRELCRSVSHNHLRDQKSAWTMTCKQWSKDYCLSNSIPQALPRMASHKLSSSSNGIPQTVTSHNNLSTPACTSVDTFVIVHAFLAHVDGCVRHARRSAEILLDCLSA